MVKKIFYYCEGATVLAHDRADRLRLVQLFLFYIWIEKLHSYIYVFFTRWAIWLLRVSSTRKG